MALRVLDQKGVPLDAHVDIEGAEFVFHSRGGKRGAANARNLDYGTALRLLLERISAKGYKIEGAWVDSDEAQHVDRERRSILDGNDLQSGPQRQFKVISARMQVFGRSPDAPYGGSRVKKIRLRVGGIEVVDLADVLELEEATGADSDMLAVAAIEADHLWEAIALVDTGSRADIGSDSQFDLLVGDCRVQPRDVMLVAARLATGRDLSAEYAGGAMATARARELLEREGFDVVPAGAAPTRSDIPISNEDKEWSEGRPILVAHLKRERSSGLTRAKKRSVLRQQGRLACEKCGLDPVETFGSESAVACLEVHHGRLEIAKMGDGGRTRLADVQLLCANCHRWVHAVMREQTASH